MGIRADSGGVADTMCVLEDGHIFGQQISHGLLGLGISIGPEWFHGVECAADTFLVGITVLNHNGLNRIWMFRRYPIADWRTVVLYIDAELLQAEILKQQVLYVSRQIVEGVFELVHAGSIAVPEAHIIWSNHMELV